MERRNDIGDPKRIVADGYDIIGNRYADQGVAENDSTRAYYTSVLIDSLPAEADVLDLGCGAGLPTTAKLAEQFNVTGVDMSGKQVKRARANVPNAIFIHADMTELDFQNESFDGVASFFSIIHMPRDEHESVIHNLALAAVGRPSRGFAPVSPWQGRIRGRLGGRANVLERLQGRCLHRFGRRGRVDHRFV